MARQPLAVGTHGTITWKHHPEKLTGAKHQAYCTFRDLDGRNRKVERWGESKSKAIAALAEATRDRRPATAATALNPRSRFSEAAERWLPRIERQRAIRTVQAYKWVLSCHVLPALGELRLIECTAGRLDDYMDELEARGFAADTRRNIKTVISGVLQLAVRDKALSANPAREMSRIEGTKRKVRALTREERAEFLARIDDLRCAHHVEKASERSCRMCAGLRRDMPDLVRWMLGTGCRIGETLGVRWCDLDLVGTDVVVAGQLRRVCTAMVGPTVVRAPGRGLVRQADGKTAASIRTIALPDHLVELLRSRRPRDAPDDFPVFPSASYTWWEPANCQKALRRARDQAGFGWVTSHIFRKTAVTILDEAGLSARVIADQVGHSRPSLTQDVYMHRGATSPAAASALDAAGRD